MGVGHVAQYYAAKTVTDHVDIAFIRVDKIPESFSIGSNPCLSALI